MGAQRHPQFSDLPPGWTVLGALPEKEPSQMDKREALSWLREDICVLIAPDSRFIIDVSWRADQPKHAEPQAGRYLCRLVKDRNWDRPKEEWHFGQTDQMTKWFFDTYERVRGLISRQK